MGMVQEMTDEQYLERLKSRIEYAQNNPGLGIFATFELDTDNYIGGANINQLDETDEIQIGYVIDEVYWGKGYATEMAKHLIDYGFIEINLDNLCAVCDQDHVVSARVLEKAGMKYLENRHHYGADLKYFQISRKLYESKN